MVNISTESKYWILLGVSLILFFIPQLKMIAPFILGFTLARLAYMNDKKRKK